MKKIVVTRAINYNMKIFLLLSVILTIWGCESITLPKSVSLKLKDWNRDTLNDLVVGVLVDSYCFDKNYCKGMAYYSNVYVCSGFSSYIKDTVVVFEVCYEPLDTLDYPGCRDYELTLDKFNENVINVPVTFKNSIYNNNRKYKYSTGQIRIVLE